MKAILFTDRLILRMLDDQDSVAVVRYLQDNRVSLAEWEPLRSEDYYSELYQKEQLRQSIMMSFRGEMCKWWIARRDQPERIIGSISLSNIARGAFQSCHLGYGLDGRERNQGFMTEALRGVIEYAFGELGLHRIEANIMPRNGASLKVVEKLGFYHEGLAYKYLKINGIWEDHIHMVLRNEAMEK